jgi:nucleotide-binding universal stress UspA family protein
VQRGCLDELAGRAAMPAHAGPQPTAVELEIREPVWHEPLRLGEVDQLAEPVGEQRLVVLRLESDLLPLAVGAAAVGDELDEGLERLRENGRLGGSLDQKLELSRVLDPSVHRAGYPAGTAANGRESRFCTFRDWRDGYMTSMNEIIVGYDGSEKAVRVLSRAADLAEALHARIVVISVTQSARVPAAQVVPERETAALPTAAGPAGMMMPMPFPEPEPELQRMPEPAEIARQQLERARMSLASRRLDAEYVAEVGEPAERLLDLAEQRGADMIVVGSGEHGLLERLLHRGVDETVAHRAHCDVLLVH